MGQIDLFKNYFIWLKYMWPCVQTNYYSIELLMLTRNTSRYITICKLFVFSYLNNWLLRIIISCNNITAYKLLILDRNTWNNVCKQMVIDYYILPLRDPTKRKYSVLNNP